MNRGRRHTECRSGEMDSAAEMRLTRLSRKYRQSQTAATAETGSPRNHDSDFKTPTRTFGPRTAAAFSAESPHNDSDIQQDIIWDATSPSPNRLRGKRGRKQATGFVNISEIVDRIAPKHGRPRVMEPTLQQWIGDSATIPCTPDVHVPKPKKKSPRATGVDDLLKLAKQFDFTMFHQDEVEDTHKQSFELLSEDILEFEDPEDVSVDTAAETEACRPHLDQHVNDDFDVLFDEPTQRVSGNLTPPASAQVSQVEAAPPVAPPAGGFTNGSADAFVDDWESDELLNDSLLLDMTQNPQKFSAPKYCSTQTLSSDSAPARGGTVLTQLAISKAEKTNKCQRRTFRLESSPHLSERRTQTDERAHCGSRTAGGASERHRVLYNTGSQCHQQTSNPEKSKVSKISVSDTQDRDLDVFFSSEPMWDDPADDELLCEVCDDVENQIQNSKGAEQTQRTAVQSHHQQPSLHKDTPTHLLAAPGRLASNISAGERVSLQRGGRAMSPAAAATAPPPASLRNNSKKQFTFRKPSNQNNVTNPGKGSINNTQAESLWRGGGVVSPAAAAPPPAPLRNNNNKEQFSFKKPSNEAVGKCSAAEIELKKQQAMERRRQRLQAAHKIT